MFTNHIYLIRTYKEDLALNNLQWLICHKTQLKTKPTSRTKSIKEYHIKKFPVKSLLIESENTFDTHLDISFPDECIIHPDEIRLKI